MGHKAPAIMFAAKLLDRQVEGLNARASEGQAI